MTKHGIELLMYFDPETQVFTIPQSTQLEAEGAIRHQSRNLYLGPGQLMSSLEHYYKAAKKFYEQKPQPQGPFSRNVLGATLRMVVVQDALTGLLRDDSIIT